MTKILIDRSTVEQALEALKKVYRFSEDPEIARLLKDLDAALAEFNPDWDRTEALQENLREHMAEIHRLRAALAEQQEQDGDCKLCTDGCLACDARRQ